ncbi:MAG TPA: MEDS domain-containing protein [Candidatus Thermoplasmatota archaeon]|nr:MEDS domain-containing protein [Candidatus Thermoplasmatota archaeon]
MVVEFDPAQFARLQPRHAVQFYQNEGHMVKALVAWCERSLRVGGGAVVVATEPHRAEFKNGLRLSGLEPDRFLDAGRLALLDARETLDRLLVRGQPSAERFEVVVMPIVRDLQRAVGSPDKPVRAWGEMVDLLWKEGEFDAASALESLWTSAVRASGIELLCSYDVSRLVLKSDQRIVQAKSEHTEIVVADE